MAEDVPKLNSENDYVLWKKKFQILLIAKDLDVILLETTDKDFKRKDAKAKFLFINSMNEKYVNYIINCETTKDMFIKLDTIFLGNKECQLNNYLEEFYKFKFTSADLLYDINVLENLVIKIKNIGFGLEDTQIISKILSSLPDDMLHLRTSWECTHREEKTLLNLISRINLEIKMRKTKNTDVEKKENSFVVVRSCFRCGQKGHIARFCDRMQTSFEKTQPKFYNIVRCFKCLEDGHKIDICKQKFNCKFCKVNTHYSKFCLEKGSKSLVSNLNFVNVFDDIDFVIDSGASCHIINSENYLFDIDNCLCKIMTADGNIHMIDRSGTLSCENNLILKDVLFVPQMKRNLLSISKLCDLNLKIVFYRNKCEIMNSNTCILTGERSDDGLYCVKLRVCRRTERDSRSADLNKIYLVKNLNFWHRALAHTSISKTKDLVRGINIDLAKDLDTCEVCVQSKLCRKPFKTERYRAKKPLEIIHTDVCGPIEFDTWDGFKYFVTFLDDYTHFVKIYLIKTKDEVLSKFKNYITLAENHFESKVKIIRCDNGGEYTSNQFRNFCFERGIVVDNTIPYTPQYNGKAERLNRTIIERTRSLLFDMKLPKELWGEAVLTSAYLTNRCYNTITNRTPAELWFGRIPNLKHLNIFGSLAYAKINNNLKKLDSRCNKGLLVGYTNNGYKLWDPVKMRIFYSRDVVFDNNVDVVENFLKDCNRYTNLKELYNLFDDNDGFDVLTNDSNVERGVSVDARNVTSRVELEDPEVTLAGINYDNVGNIERIVENFDRVGDDIVVDGGLIDNVEDNCGFINVNDCEERNLSDRCQMDNVEDNGDNLVEDEVFEDALDTVCEDVDDTVVEGRRMLPNRNRRLPVRFKDYDMESSFLTFNEALESDEKHLWDKAIKEEKDSLEKNKIWEVVDRSKAKGRKIISSKWIFTVKPCGRYKARLVARGFLQKYDIDYKETYSPVVNTTSVRLLLSIAAQRGLTIKQFDVKTAFLYGDLDEEIFMEVPLGYNIDKSKNVCKLKKSLYGLKQASLMWNRRLTSHLKSLGFMQLKLDPCLFLCRDKEIYLAIYVDDGILIGNDINELDKILLSLEKEFKIRKFDKVEKFIGLDINVGENYIKIYQKSYIEQLLEKYNFTGLRECLHPDIFIDAHQEGKSSESDVHKYRQFVGSLLYLVNKTRLDLSFHVGYCSRHQENSNLNDLSNIKNIFRYLKGTVAFGIRYLFGNDFSLRAYCDSDFAGDPDTRKSTTGFVILFGGGPVHWCSRKQSVTALSSTEAEYISAAECIKDLLYVQSLIREIFGKTPVTELYVDNQSAIFLMKNGILNRRSKHIDVKFHFIKEKIDLNHIKLFYCPTNLNIADILTKGLDRTKFLRLRNSVVNE